MVTLRQISILALQLATSFEQEPVYISESAIFTAADARMLAPLFLVAFSLGQPSLKANNVAEK